MICKTVGSAAFAFALSLSGAMAEATYSLLDWSDLREWESDNHAEAAVAFLETCVDLKGRDWEAICAVAQNEAPGRSFFEMFFRPVLIEDGVPGLFTGYFEPELKGSLTRTPDYRWPLYRKPPEVKPGARWHTRAEIEEKGLLAGRGLEIAWVDDPVDAFFLQIQGSGRVSLPDGGKLRLGYGGRNGHDYRSVGNELVRRGLFQSHEVSAGTIRRWVRENPEEGARLLRHNPSFIFFREVNDVPSSAGPLGAMNRSVTALRSIAVDPAFVELGAPVWIETGGKNPLHRLMIAQDTGSAIKGAQRADIFFGTGAEAGRAAGRVRDPGRMIVLLPVEAALELTGEG